MMRWATSLCIAAVATACTPGGLASSASGSGGQVTIDVNLTLHPAVSTFAGESGGYAPPVTTVAVGTTIDFTNSDSFAHTATLIPGAATFPSGSSFSTTALTQKGSAVSRYWSTGALQPGASSQTITIDAPGTFIYGCFFHYGAPMRGAIVAH
jgi:plastocyanin